MTHQALYHHIDADPISQRAFVAAAAQLGIACHCYRGIEEFLARSDGDGIVLLHDQGHSSLVRQLLDRCAALGRWPGVVVYAAAPDIEQVVEAMQAGALSYHRTPQDRIALASVLGKARIAYESDHAARREAVRANANLARLSPRERQVLQGLVRGESNKEIAHVLNISPRTVEIHRMNMMGKLGARNAAEAIRLGLCANLSRGRTTVAGVVSQYA